MKRIYSAASLPEAHLILHRLRAEGIACAVFNENAQGGVGELPFTHAYPEVWIEDTVDEPLARRIVDEFERGADDADGGPCAGCGEHNPASFEVCWNCGAVLAAP